MGAAVILPCMELKARLLLIEYTLAPETDRSNTPREIGVYRALNTLLAHKREAFEREVLLSLSISLRLSSEMFPSVNYTASLYGLRTSCS